MGKKNKNQSVTIRATLSENASGVTCTGQPEYSCCLYGQDYVSSTDFQDLLVVRQTLCQLYIYILPGEKYLYTSISTAFKFSNWVSMKSMLFHKTSQGLFAIIQLPFFKKKILFSVSIILLFRFYTAYYVSYILYIYILVFFPLKISKPLTSTHTAQQSNNVKRSNSFLRVSSFNL